MGPIHDDCILDSSLVRNRGAGVSCDADRAK